MRKTWLMPGVMLGAILGAGGCAVAPDLYRQVEDGVRAAARQADTGGGAPRPGVAAQAPLTATALLAEVARHDLRCRLARQDIELAALQMGDARLQPWPRLFADGLVEMPIKDGRAHTHTSGGLYLRLDVVRAFLYRNAVTVADVTQAAAREKLRWSTVRAAADFLGTATRLDTALRAQSRQESVAALAVQSCTDAERFYRMGQIAAERWYGWQNRVAQQAMARQQIAGRVARLRAELHRAYRGDAEESVLRALAAGLLERLTALPAGPDDEAAVVAEMPAVLDAKMAWFLAEMTVFDARLKRLPSVSLDLGGGSIPVRGDEDREEGHLVPSLGISLPLIDMGDIGRGVARARLRADQARERMVETVETARLDLAGLRERVALSVTSLQTAQTLVEALNRRYQDMLALSGAGAASILDTREAAWMLAEAETAADQAREEQALAWLDERVACGTLLDSATLKAMGGGDVAERGDQ